LFILSCRGEDLSFILVMVQAECEQLLLTGAIDGPMVEVRSQILQRLQ